ncbi:hypothetical protein [Burkholderia cepacia]|uniref:hypothetical protein n=1 Tax=Burkholderia cepacia TaxID=292 RepID=UPI002AB5F5BF|nr:hypothetical protein [Burkholderia cepacia]
MNKNIVIRLLDRITAHFLWPIVGYVVGLVVAAAILTAKQVMKGCPLGCVGLKATAVFRQWDAELLLCAVIFLLGLAYMIRLSVYLYSFEKN